jgi:hypothetical protein
LSNTFSTFYFKMINNVLGFNYIISHFIPDIDRNCTFCNLVNNPDEEDETPLHLFYTCSVSENIIEQFFNTNVGFRVTRQEFFAVPKRDNTHTNTIIFLICGLIKKYFWDCKQRYSLPSLDLLTYKVESELRIACKISKKILAAMEGAGVENFFKQRCLK